MKHRHFLNTYLTTTISISLVLFLIGLEAVLSLATRQAAAELRQKVTVSLMLDDNADADEMALLEEVLKAAPYCHEYKYVSKDDALKEYLSISNDDPLAVLDGFNPLYAYYDISVSHEYANNDSLQSIENKLSAFTCVQQIQHDSSLLEALESNIHKASLPLLILAGILLFIAIALIINTVRLQIYSQRFLIRTMQLVGATPFVVKRPIVNRNILMGIYASIIALLLLAGTIYLAQTKFLLHLLDLTWQNIAIVSGIVVLSAIILTALASVFATNHYIKMKTDDLYYI